MKTPIDNRTIEELRNAVETKVGFDVTSARDCEILAMEIERFDRRFALSVSTLRRVFGLIERKSDYTVSTLNSLARFCGFRSFKHWQETSKTHEAFPESKATHYTEKSDTMSIADTIASLDTVIDTLSANMNLRLSANQLKNAKDAATHLFRHQAMPEWLWKKANRHPLARLMMESYPPLDYLSGFGLDLIQDFLETSEKETDEIFAKSLIVSSAIYQGTETKSTYDSAPTILELKRSAHPIPQARALGVNLLALSDGIKTPTNSNENFRSLIIEGIHDEVSIWPNWSIATCPFVIKICQWVILAKDKELCEIAIHGIGEYRKRQEFSLRRYKYDNLLDLWLSWLFYMTNQEKVAKSLLDSVSPERFPQHEERTLLIWYHQLIKRIGSDKRKKSSDISLDLLTSQTGYKGLDKRLADLIPIV